MKILLLNWRDLNNPKAGGAERVTYEHTRRWAQVGHTVTWFTAMYEGAKELDEYECVHFIRRGNWWSVYLHAICYVAKHGNKFDVIVDEFHGIPFFSLIVTKTPVIAFIHEVAGVIWQYMFPWPMSIIGRNTERIALMLYRRQHFWTDAASVANELSELGIPQKAITVIPCPIPENIKTLSIPKQRVFTCIFVSRLVPMKGIEDVIRAFAKIHLQDQSAQLWVIGKGESDYTARVTQLVYLLKLEKRVHFFGEVSEEKKYNLLRRAHMLLHASVKEGWGLVVLEAAVQGTPSVVYNTTGLRDVVKHNKTGIVVDTNNPDTLAKEAIALYINKKRYATFQQAGIRWVRSLRWDAASMQSLALLDRVAKKKKRIVPKYR